MKTIELTNAEALIVAKELGYRADDARGFGNGGRADELERIAGLFE